MRGQGKFHCRSIRYAAPGARELVLDIRWINLCFRLIDFAMEHAMSVISA
jgi:hypothetical protein